MSHNPLSFQQVTEIDQPHRDGRLMPTEVVTTVRLDDQGAVTEILGVSRDITERRLAEATLRESEFCQRPPGHPVQRLPIAGATRTLRRRRACRVRAETV